ncbi:MAG: hypothetical protein AABO41_21635 [Acidobacteriota bacterium]
MNRYFGKMLLIGCLLAGVGAVTTKAQIDSDTPVEADIPHAFLVGDKTLPAGKYTIKVLNDTNLNLFEIRSSNRHTAVAFETENVQADRTPRQTELVFNKIGDQYFLSQIWVSESNYGVQVEKSKMEQGLEGKGMNSERHSVAAHHKSSKKTKQAKTENSSE